MNEYINVITSEGKKVTIFTKYIISIVDEFHSSIITLVSGEPIKVSMSKNELLQLLGITNN